MAPLKQAAEEFLSQQRIAVAGVSRDHRQPANLIYRRLRDHGHTVFAVNPNAAEVEGDRCYPDVRSLPERVDGVVVVTTPEVSEGVVRACHAAGVERVWLHRGIGPGSVSDAAVAYCRDNGIEVIPGGCPNMFGETGDTFHRCLRAVSRASGKLPRDI